MESLPGLARQLVVSHPVLSAVLVLPVLLPLVVSHFVLELQVEASLVSALVLELEQTPVLEQVLVLELELVPALLWVQRAV